MRSTGSPQKKRQKTNLKMPLSPEEIRLRNCIATAKWRSKNREKASLASKRWREANPEKQAAARKRWEENNLEKRRGYSQKRQEMRNEESRQWRLKNPGHIYTKYEKRGISRSDIEAKVLSQEGKCAICKEIKNLCVDHCHVTGKFRGMLCSPCNSALGFLKDSFFNLIRAADYIRRA